MTFILPATCQTCGSEAVTQSIDRRYSSTESAEYKCGARYHTYLTHRRIDIQKPCPQSPAEKTKAARELEIDSRVAKALNAVKATYAECEAFCKRMERDKGWSRRSGEGIWPLLNVKPPRDDQ